MGAIREGRWDCPSCGSIANLGRNVNCLGCGLPRPDDIRFYLPEDAEAVSDAERLSEATAGADWVCEHCGASARATQDDCPGCGAPRGSSKWQETVEYGLDDTPRSGRAQRVAAMPARPKPKRRINVRGWLFLALLAAGAWWWFHPRQVQGEVALKTWERSLEVQAYRTVRESDWQLPSGGRQLRSYRAIRDYRQELDHYERRTRQVSDRVQVGTEEYTCGTIDRGNGYFEDRMCDRPVYETRYRTEEYQEPVYRKVPIWATKYDYEIERWVRDTVLKAAGEADERNDPDEAEWPTPRLGKDRREGERTELYRLEFRTPDGDVYQREVPLRLFDEYDVGEPVKLRVRRSGTVEILGPDGKPLS